MRTYIRQALVNDAPLAALGVVAANIVSGDADSVRGRPMLNLQWGDTNAGMGPVYRRNLVIWVHDAQGSYDRIDAILRRIRTVLTGLVGGSTGVGSLVQIEWLTDSGDLRNDDRKTVLRTATYTVVGSGM
jgi:hypothetical protein